ncbi:uncharacterized protein DNG_10119 [Cephalotrichum gorgonifer]|uniref:Uncharacterized protein n=1 Tax=Cephalotrichum gorgonifer TaxID=2041049 RepID=A0AAE8T008_9PEZI|nr:uncharacterized protein DNG_10119 [Cephalotrichum gorgonifer]
MDEVIERAVSSAVYGKWTSMGVTTREQRMMSFIGNISDTPDWEHLVFNEKIVKKWRARVDMNQPETLEDAFLSKEMFDFCIQELRDKAEIAEETGQVNVLDSELTIIKSDTTVPNAIRNALRRGVKKLEQTQKSRKDWHPDSDRQVLNLVDPSLFPIVFGLTRVLRHHKEMSLKDCIGYTGMGKIIDDTGVRPPDGDHKLVYGSYQWLPTDVRLTCYGAKIIGYINNLHPKKHCDLYEVLEGIIAMAVPLWEDCLSGFHSTPRIPFQEVDIESTTFPEGLKYRIPGREGPRAWYDPITDTLGGRDGTDDDMDLDTSSYFHFDCDKYCDCRDKCNCDCSCNPRGYYHIDEYEGEGWVDDAFRTWLDEHQIPCHKEPRGYISQARLNRGGARIKLKDAFWEEGLQICFKFANIYLTPENPQYHGDTWQVEGTSRERICASAIYYYEQKNVTKGHLEFRQPLRPFDISIFESLEGDTRQNLHRVLGVRSPTASTQNLGRILTRNGRLIVFPNCVHHRVQPFSLQDKTKPGHCKILSMFLFDPSKRVPSTSTVPPQQRDWWAEEVRKHQSLLRVLPQELFDHTIAMVDDFPISWEKAVEIRRKLMEERDVYLAPEDDPDYESEGE